MEDLTGLVKFGTEHKTMNRAQAESMVTLLADFHATFPVLKYDDIDEVIVRANNSEYGLSGTVWGKDVERAIGVAERIQSGTVWVNQHLAIDPSIPFRGAKQSGFGGELGEEGLHEYTQAKIVNAAFA